MASKWLWCIFQLPLISGLRPVSGIVPPLRAARPGRSPCSTFPETRSGWLRGDLIGRVQASTGKPVEHVVTEEDG